jgi:hypothetical protein
VKAPLQVLSTMMSSAATSISATIWKPGLERSRISVPFDAGPLAPPLLVGRHVGHVRPVALARVDDLETGGARGGNQPVDCRQDRPQRRRIITMLGEVACRRQEVFLQIDDDKGGVCSDEIAVIGKIEWDSLDHIGPPFFTIGRGIV